MGKKLTGKALAKFEAERDLWKEVLEGVKQIKAGGGKRTEAQPASQVFRVRHNGARAPRTVRCGEAAIEDRGTPSRSSD